MVAGRRLILILLVLGVRGCLDARKERGFENYVSDLDAIVDPVEPALERVLRPARGPAGEPRPSSASRPRSPPTAAPPRACCSASRGSTPPDDARRRPERARAGLRAAPRRARRDRRRHPDRARQRRAAARRSTGSPTTCATSSPATSSTRAPARDQRRRSTTRASSRAGRRERLPPRPDRPLARPRSQLTTTLSGVRRQHRDATAGHPRPRAARARRSTRRQLTPDAEQHGLGSATSRRELDVEVQNQGDSEETDVTVTYSLSGGAVPIEGEGTIAEHRRRRDRRRPRCRLDDLPETGRPADARGRGAAGARRAADRQQHRHLHGRLQLSPRVAVWRSVAMIESPTSARPGPSARTRCARAAAATTIEPLPDADDPRRDPRRRRAARPTGRWSRSRTRSRARCAPTLDTLAFDAPSVTIVGEHDQPIRNSLIARDAIAAGRDRGRPLPPAGERAVRPLHPRGAARGRGPRRAEHRRGGARGRRVATSPGRRSGPPRRRELYGCVVLREGVEDEPDNVTRFVWIAPHGTSAVGRRAVADHADLLRAGRGPPGRAGRGADRVLEPRAST